MMAATLHAVGAVPALVAEGHCAGCQKPLVLVQMPHAKITQRDVVCARCAPAMRDAS